MVLQIPVSAAQGYVHPGDSMILLTAVFFGRKKGALQAASVLLRQTCAHRAPFTLIIKGIMGYLIGAISDFQGERSKFFTARMILASVIGIIWMVFGYFTSGAILKSRSTKNCVKKYLNKTGRIG